MKELIKSRIEALLSKEFYCDLKELNEKATIYSVNPNTKQSYIKILIYRNCIVVCTSESLQSKISEILQGKNRDEIFELPFVYGQTIHYVPDGDILLDVKCPSVPAEASNTGCPKVDTLSDSMCYPAGYQYESLFNKEIFSLVGLTGFENSLAFDETGFTSTKAVCLAKDNERIIGVAGAAESSIDGVWEVGIDVLEEYRNAGLGTYLVRKLTKELLKRNVVPFYSASVTNIGSQMVASRCGYIPFWVDTFGTIFDGSSAYNALFRKGLADPDFLNDK